LSEDNEIVLKAGGNTIETINTVLPLYDKEDSDLRSLIKTRLFDMLMTFSVMQNIDTCYD
jgi:hypothetical protein